MCSQDKLSAACNQPLLSADAQDKIKVTAVLKAGASQLKTIDNLPAKRVVVKACYGKPSTVDRPWRKADGVIDVSLLTVVVVFTGPGQATNGSHLIKLGRGQAVVLSTYPASPCRQQVH